MQFFAVSLKYALHHSSDNMGLKLLMALPNLSGQHGQFRQQSVSLEVLPKVVHDERIFADLLSTRQNYLHVRSRVFAKLHPLTCRLARTRREFAILNVPFGIQVRDANGYGGSKYIHEKCNNLNIFDFFLRAKTFVGQEGGGKERCGFAA